jgi:ubiquinone/menaquinone biosynthesis C-methylase UbiE
MHGDDFARFEHQGWQRVADKYDSVWSSLTRQFISSLLEDASVSAGMLALDVACGPGYVSAAAKQLRAVPTGIDLSEKMVAIAKRMFPEVRFTQGDARDLPFEDGSFDRVLMNFGLLHISQPEKACAEACRVLKREASLVLLFGRDQSGTRALRSLMTRLKLTRIWMSACPKDRRNICTANGRNAGKC